jgi:hypothetical protein
MLETYKAILRGDRLEWSGDAPEREDAEQGIEVYVTILQSEGGVASNGKAMVEALAKIAASGALSEISDPSAWQREQRHDRPLPDRDA